MPSKLENALPLFISVRKWVGSVFTSGITFNFTQVKVKKVGMSQSYSKSYLKFRLVPELSHNVHQGINPLSKTPSSLFFAKPPANCPSPPLLGNFTYILFFVTPPPLKIDEPQKY